MFCDSNRLCLLTQIGGNNGLTKLKKCTKFASIIFLFKFANVYFLSSKCHERRKGLKFLSSLSLPLWSKGLVFLQVWRWVVAAVVAAVVVGRGGVYGAQLGEAQTELLAAAVAAAVAAAAMEVPVKIHIFRVTSKSAVRNALF